MDDHRVIVLKGRRGALAAAAFEAALAVAAVASAAAFFLDPDVNGAAAISLFGGLAWAFQGLYLAGGLLILAGFGLGSLRAELAGLIFLAGALATNVVAVLDVRAVTALTTTAVLGAVLAACVVRGVIIYRAGRR